MIMKLNESCSAFAVKIIDKDNLISNQLFVFENFVACDKAMTLYKKLYKASKKILSKRAFLDVFVNTLISGGINFSIISCEDSFTLDLNKKFNITEVK